MPTPSGSQLKIRWIIGSLLVVLILIGLGLFSFAYLSERKSSTHRFLSRSEATNAQIEEQASKIEYKVHSSSPAEKRIVVSRARLTPEGLLSLCERLHLDMTSESKAIVHIFSSNRSADKWMDPKVAVYSQNSLINHLQKALIEWNHVGTYLKFESLASESCMTAQRGLLQDTLTTVDYAS
jgi:hypothetical protein